MRFWDSSAIIPLLVAEPRSLSQRSLWPDDESMVVWWATEVECVSAIERRLREGSIPLGEGLVAYQLLDQLASRWIEVSPSPAVRRLARRFLKAYSLRAADALQLAAACLANADQAALAFVCLDDRLRLAAAREGLPVLP